MYFVSTCMAYLLNCLHKLISFLSSFVNVHVQRTHFLGPFRSLDKKGNDITVNMNCLLTYYISILISKVAFCIDLPVNKRKLLSGSMKGF